MSGQGKGAPDKRQDHRGEAPVPASPVPASPVPASPVPAGGTRGLTVSVEFTLTRQEFQLAQRQMMLRSLLIAGLSGLMVAIVIAGIVTGNGSAVVIGIFWFVLIGLVFSFAPGSAWRRNPVVQGVQRHTFGEFGSDLSFSGRVTRVEWEYFTQLVKGPGAYQLLRGKKFGLVVPRRAFRSGHDDQAFIELVGRHLPPRRGLQALRKAPRA